MLLKLCNLLQGRKSPLSFCQQMFNKLSICWVLCYKGRGHTRGLGNMDLTCEIPREQIISPAFVSVALWPWRYCSYPKRHCSYCSLCLSTLTQCRQLRTGRAPLFIWKRCRVRERPCLCSLGNQFILCWGCPCPTTEGSFVQWPLCSIEIRLRFVQVRSHPSGFHGFRNISMNGL